ncbi:helix-turn-helix transcriptional regulator [Fictibacillus sp. Mic-4]|uniref:helix-turn-helix domain-containing protein n=1 Tax=Fictibacillus sp. Mic-4 TaxID=3132826 RepID=UPI003CEC7860
MEYNIELQGRDLITFRNAHSLSRRQLAEKVGLSYSYIAAIEKDEVRISEETENRIRDILGITDHRLERYRSLSEALRNV